MEKTQPSSIEFNKVWCSTLQDQDNAAVWGKLLKAKRMKAVILQPVTCKPEDWERDYEDLLS
jgi:hypothetical protein